MDQVKMGQKGWYYLSGNRPIGPVSAQTIQELLDTQVISPDTLVWTEGLDTWKPISSITVFKTSLSVPPPVKVMVSKNTHNTFKPSGPQVRPWIRFWARTMDVTLFGGLIGLLAGIVYPPLLNSKFFGWIANFLYVFVEPIMLSIWGTTPGKALLRIRLSKSSEEKLTYAEALDRSINVWVRGLGMGIPLVSIFTLTIAYRRLKRDGITAWDREGGFAVTHQEIGLPRVLVMILFFTGILFLALMADQGSGF